MGIQLFTDNPVTTLAANLPSSGAGSTTMQVASAALFPPTLTNGNWFVVTIQSIVSGLVTAYEIVQVTAISGVNWTIVRAQEGTTAQPWVTGNTVALLITAGGLNGFLQQGNQYPITPIESAQSITPTNLNYPAGVVDRYGTNTTPGTSDMSPAVNLSIKQMLAGGSPVKYLNGAYNHATSPSFLTITNKQTPIEISGEHLSTQLIFGAAAGTGFLWNLPSGAYLHDLILSGENANGGVLIDGTTTVATRCLIERVYSLMPGIGFQLKNTNSHVIRDCWHWADTAPALPVPQTVTSSNIGHGIYATGGFVNDISIYDFQSAVSPNYASGQRWIKNDATNSLNFRIRGGLPVNESPGTSQKLLELGNAAGGSHIIGAEVIGVYHESGYLEFNNVSFSNIYSCTNGGVPDASGVGLNFANSSQANVVGANSESGASLVLDGGSGANMILGGFYASISDSVNPAVIAPNTYMASNRVASYGGLKINNLTYSTGMTPNLVLGNYIRIVATNTTAFSINAPVNPNDPSSAPSQGQEPITIVIFNTSGGALGSISWDPIFVMSAWTSPANGFNRSITFNFDGVHWVQSSQTGVDVPNT